MSETNQLETEQQAETIARQNDRFRKSWGADFGIVGTVVVTQGVIALAAPCHTLIMSAVMGHTDFSKDNDPYGYHDFGAFEIEADGTTYALFWKIDLYDPTLNYGSNQPTVLAATRRVMTVMLRSEY